MASTHGVDVTSDRQPLTANNNTGRVRVQKTKSIAIGVAVGAIVLIACAIAIPLALNSNNVPSPSPSPGVQCPTGFCTKFASEISVMKDMPGEAPSLLSFSQTLDDRAQCVVRRAFVVGGVGTAGWAQMWSLSTNPTALGNVTETTVLVSSSSGVFNWPHAIVQDPCSGSLFVADADDNVVDTLQCQDPTAGAGCTSFAAVQNWTSQFFNPLGLHSILTLDDVASGSCPDSTSNPPMFVTGGVTSTDSYVGKRTTAGVAQILVPPSLEVLDKVYSPSPRVNGSVVVADAFNNRIAQVDCADANSNPVACADATATSATVSTILSTYYPRAVEVVVNANGTEVAFVAGGDATASTTYVKQINLNTGEVSTVIEGVFNNPHCVVVDPTSLDLIVCDKGNNRVVRLRCDE